MNRTTPSPFQLLGGLDRFLSQTLNAPVCSDNPHRIYRSENGVRLEVELPGLTKDDVKLNRESRKLSVETTEASEHDFSREFEIGTDYDLSKIEASLNKGLLRIDIPKAEEVVTTQEITIN